MGFLYAHDEFHRDNPHQNVGSECHDRGDAKSVYALYSVELAVDFLCCDTCLQSDFSCHISNNLCLLLDKLYREETVLRTDDIFSALMSILICLLLRSVPLCLQFL